MSEAKAKTDEAGKGVVWYVYILRSVPCPDQEYTGFTADLKRRLADHDSGKSAHTAKFVPWNVIWYCAFPDRFGAIEFEKYLKSHSGRAFAKKRLYVQRLGKTQEI